MLAFHPIASRSVRLAFAFALALAAAWLACSPPGPPNIVIVVLDTARPDWLSVYGHPRPTSPFLEAFAQDGVRFDRAYSTSSWTLPAHASMFSGLLPAGHRATQQHPKLAQGVPLLAERLARAGYETAGFSNNPWVSHETGLARGFAHFEERWKQPRGAAPAQTDHPTLRAVERWLGARDPAKPFFLFVNLIEPHMPYQPDWEAARPFFPDQQSWLRAIAKFFPNGKSKALKDRQYTREDPLRPDEWEALRSLYEGELRLTDAITQAIVVAASAPGGAADTLVILVSDHGENLGDHGHLGHVFNLYDSNVRIALLVRGPGFEPGRVEGRLVQITDVYATVLHAAGLEVENAEPSRDLRGPLPDDRLLSIHLDVPVQSLAVFSRELRESGALSAYERRLDASLGERLKLIRGSDGSVEIYDLLADPGELRALSPASAGSEAMRRLEAAIDVTGEREPGAAGLPEDEQTLEALRSLGYVQ